MQGVAKKPGEHGTAATAKPEATGEFRPTVSGEEIRRGIVDGDVSGGDVGLLAGLVVQQEQQSQQMNCADGSKEACGRGILSVSEGATNRVGAVKQISEGSACLNSSEIR